ncbi:SDR family oxidoreductase [Caulobacter soli]|uniref:SDR family oxidoreductase n=1 Tax=Caulobacter soli TaxID=2708539 RepID=UPI0013EBF6FE|nr:SDR family oxidoreductase [Caulobacter soli]
MTRLTGKRALITGGTSGIGLETARQFIAEGARVAVTGTNPATLEEARLALGPDAIVLRSNAGDVADQKALAGKLKDAFGQIDAVFINAGVAELKPLEAWDEEGFDRTFDINVKGPLFLVQALTPILANPASIILNGSINAHIGMANSSVYAASKAALISLGKTLSGELISRGVRVNTISPGPIQTPLYGKLGFTEAQLQDVAGSILGQIPAGRFGAPSEVAKAAVFLASDESTFTVGAELVIDGGMSTL